MFSNAGISRQLKEKKKPWQLICGCKPWLWNSLVCAEALVCHLGYHGIVAGNREEREAYCNERVGWGTNKVRWTPKPRMATSEVS